MRFLTTTYEEYLNIAKSNGYEVYDTSIDTFESWNIYTNSYETKTITTYYFEYDENLYWLLATNNYNYWNYENPGGFTLGQIASLIRLHRFRVYFTTDVISIDEEPTTIEVLKLQSSDSDKDIIDYLSDSGYSYDLKVEFAGDGGVENFKEYIYKVNRVNDFLDKRSEKLIELLEESYEKKSVNGKISIPRPVKYSLVKIEG